jgi:truncated hemoglobin YjbI
LPSLYGHAGGEDALHHLEDTFYTSVLADPLLQPLFGAGRPEHVDHLTAFTAESFGGSDRFTRELGFGHLIGVHRGLRITEAQPARFVQLYMAALEESGCRPTSRSARQCAHMSSLDLGWPCRIPTPAVMMSSTLSARRPDGPGRATTRQSEDPARVRNVSSEAASGIERRCDG